MADGMTLGELRNVTKNQPDNDVVVLTFRGDDGESVTFTLDYVSLGWVNVIDLRAGDFMTG